MCDGSTMPLQRRLDDFLRCGGNDEELEAVAVDALGEALGEQIDVRLQPDATADLHEVLAPHAAVLGIVQQQIRQLAALLHQVEARQTGDLLDEARRPEQLAQDDTRIVEAQRLIEIAREQELLSHTNLHRSTPGPARS